MNMKKIKALLMALCLLFTLMISIAACNSEKPDTSSRGSSSAGSGTSGGSDSSDASSDLDVSGDTDIWSGPDGSDGSNGSDDSEIPDSSDMWNDPEDTDFDDEEAVYQIPIQKSGTAVTGNNRTITVDLNKTVFNSYSAVGSNVLSATMSEEGKRISGMNEVLFELEKKRIASLASPDVRLLFNIDWMITNTETNPQRSDWKNNKDYINYINGTYNFNSDYIKSVCIYLDALKDAKTNVLITFGWKVSNRIAKWFPVAGTSNMSSAAPRDLDAFGKACAALLNELINVRGYTNVKYVSFYNEPDGEFTFLGNKPNYYGWMMQKAHDSLKKYNLQQKTEVWGFEGNVPYYNTQKTWLDGIRAVAGAIIKGYTIHSYYVTSIHKYHDYFDYYTDIYSKLKASMYVTEYSGEDWANGKLGVAKEEEWNYSSVSTLIFTANTGMRGLMCWDTYGGYVPEPVNGLFSVADGWNLPTNETSVNTVRPYYNEASLLSNYIGANAKVLHVSWTGEDIRMAAFKRADGEITVVAEANAAGAARTLNINFGKALNKSVYKYEVYPSVAAVDTTVPVSVKTFSGVGTSFTDTVGKDYTVYIYTTAAPVKQISIGKVWYNCTKGASVQLNASTIACAANAQLSWSVTKATGSKGTVSQTGLYTPPADAKSGDLVSVKVSLQSDPSVYNIALIKIN